MKMFYLRLSHAIRFLTALILLIPVILPVHIIGWIITGNDFFEVVEDWVYKPLNKLK